MNVAIIGASKNPERYSHKAQKMLMEHGHGTFPVSLSGDDILDREGFKSIQDIPDEDRPIHTATIYLKPDRFAEIADEVLEFQPGRIIFNPGTESPAIAARFREAGIHVVEACTLVLLATGQFGDA